MGRLQRKGENLIQEKKNGISDICVLRARKEANDMMTIPVLEGLFMHRHGSGALGSPGKLKARFLLLE